MLISGQENAMVRAACVSATPHLGNMTQQCLPAVLHFVVFLALYHVTLSLNLKKSRQTLVSCIDRKIYFPFVLLLPGYKYLN